MQSTSINLLTRDGGICATFQPALTSEPGLGKPRSMGIAQLSSREIDVLWLTAWGYTGNEIAARLIITSKTVTTYKNRAATKLGLKTRVDIVQHAKKNKWFEVDPLVVDSFDSKAS